MYGSALVLILSLVSQVSGITTTKYDKFRDRTFYSVDLMKLPGEEGYSNITAGTSLKGKNPDPIDENGWISIHIYRSGKDWKYLRDHETGIMCGDDHIPFLHDKTPTYSHDIDDGDCNESINMTFSVETMKKFLAKNEDWDIKIGYGEPFSLGKREKAKIKTFIKALEKNGS